MAAIDEDTRLVAPSLLDCLGLTEVGPLIYSYLEPGELKPQPTLLEEVANIDGLGLVIFCFLI